MEPTDAQKMTLWSKIKFVGMAGVGLYSDGYLNIVIGLVVPMLGYIYWPHGSVPATQGSEIKGSLSIGMIIGQLFFGIFGDALGRHKVYGKELLFTIFGTLLVVLLPWRGLSTTGIVAWLSVFRVVTGIGTGGDYPMSSSLSAEKTPFGSRSRLILTVFSCIGAGGFSSSVVNIILLTAFKGAIHKNIKHLEWVWRLLLGLGVIPAACSVYARFTMKETTPYEKYVAKETSLTGPATRGLKAQMRDFRVYFRDWRHARTLFAVCGVWFLYDIAFYGVNLNQSIILAQIGYGKGKTPYETLHNTAVGSLIVQAAGYLPGFYIGIFLPDLFGRRATQFWCCVGTAILYAIWAGVTGHASTGGLMTIFTLSQLVLNSGPNCTTFLLPVEVFPTRVRGTAHGLAAASGKAGALLTSFAFGTAVENIGIRGVLGLFAGIMALAALLTLWIPETKGFSIDDIENDLLYRPNGSTIEAHSDESTYFETPEMKAHDPVITKSLQELA